MLANNFRRIEYYFHHRSLFVGTLTAAAARNADK